MRLFSGFRGRSMGLIAVAATLAIGCSKQLPQQVTDVNRAVAQAKDACAGVYATDQLRALEGRVEAMNDLADQKKYKKARKAAEPLLPEVQQVQDAAEQGRADAGKRAEAAVADARAKLRSAEDKQAPELAASQYRDAAARLEQAQSRLSNPCQYGEAERLAREAAGLADAAATAAVAESKRREEEARLAEQRRREEEERRRAEEERRRREMFPPSYTVQRGDSLWRISGMDKIYGKPVYWPLLYDANRERIKDPDLIYPGQGLKIPRDLSAAEMERRLHLLWRDMAGEGSQED